MTDAGRTSGTKDKTKWKPYALTLLPEYNSGTRLIPQVTVKNIGFSQGLQKAIIDGVPIYNED